MDMSELKAYIAPTPDGTGLADYYLKYEADKVIAEKDAEILRMIDNWNRLCEKYNKLIKLKQEFCDKFKDIELEITK